ncbi:receptor-like protein 7 [Dioscorea cayenensis subsp. rotundata]|uniref:Receptor-like protein 7 n=1 Tax=Dioscorea cayennensis subsp. rotundata TaxID=55577 RepID=A0AB40BQN8_DIOCR|nr:receptor-like protein 7 [Dioscorea cayenensis subsp. rotundata]
MMCSHHRGGSFSFLFSIPSCFFFLFILVLLSLSSSSSSTNALSAHSQQCLDLLDLKKGFIKLNESDYYYYHGPATTSLPHWHAGTNCCGWEGVSCDKASGLVVSLDLSERYMGGNIMPSLFNLTSIQTLNLAYNDFNQSATLLSDFDKLANLTHLNLSHSGLLAGQVPMGISRLTKLISFDLSSYSYGPYALKLEKPDLGTLIRDLSNLKELYLDGANISSSGTEWCHAISDPAPGLQALSLRDSSLSGPIDSSLSKLRNLSILRLHGNDLSSQVPDFFANFSSLTELSLSECGLQGVFPTGVFELLSLKTLDLSFNPMLAGFLPEFPLNSSLETLTIYHTNFSGSLPNSLGNLESLIYLDLSDCNFSGSIPWSIGNLSELVSLDLSSNYLSGYLPLMLAGSKFSTIDLSSNYFIGQIPSSLGHAHHLTSLHLEDNLLTGSIPMSLFTLPILEELYLSDNKLSGQLQEFTNASSILQYVDLPGNNLGGKLPKSLVNLSALISLDLSSNNFDGSVVGLELFGHLQNLTYLDLSGIDLSISDRNVGSSLLFPSLDTLILQSCNLMAIPSFLKYKENMELLDLSNNRIHGIIPKWIWSNGSYGGSMNLSCNLFTDIERPRPDPLTMMSINSLDLHSNMLQGQIPLLQSQFLDYSNNYFTGSIPVNISAYLLDTSFFSLANNNLTGEIPTSICHTNLRVLDLSNNSLSGSIHKCLLESLSNLQVLNLRRNQFQGILPRNINSSCSLVIINFYGNQLEGEIPKFLAKCEQLQFLDIGSNKLADSFPYWLGNLPALKVLVLRENKFYGYFECPLVASVGNHTFEVMQILDISSNNFTGNLPLDCFTRMKAMMIHREGDGTIGFSYNSADLVKYNNLKLNKNQARPVTRSCLLIYACPSDGSYNPASTYYEDLVTIVAKGYKRDQTKIPATTSYIDVSNNRLEGTLPEVIGDLKSLNFLNMSLNAFKGHIPQVFGNLRELESLDLSGNQLSGEIPNSLTSLTFLSVLNLSNNNLVGRIPQGNQFNTFPNASFEGNPGLCGFPLSRHCVNSTSMEPSTDLNNASHELDMEEIWIWMFRGLGFGVGFALAIFHQLLFTKLKIWYKRRFR